MRTMRLLPWVALAIGSMLAVGLLLFRTLCRAEEFRTAKVPPAAPQPAPAPVTDPLDAIKALPQFAHATWTPLPTWQLDNMRFGEALDVSRDGTHALGIWTTDPGRRHLIVVSDLITGTKAILKESPGEPIDLLHAYEAYWDPQHPQFFFFNALKTSRLNDDVTLNISTIWRMRFDGQQRTIVKDRIAYNHRPTTDGLWLSMAETKTDDVSGQSFDYDYLQSLSDARQQKPVTWKGDLFSPDMQYVTETYPFSVYSFVRPNAGQITVFTPKQTTFAFPHDFASSAYESTMRWLPDSNGILISITGSKLRSEIKQTQLWWVSVTGAARQLCTDVKLLGASSDGRYWLFQHKDTVYRVAIT